MTDHLHIHIEVEIYDQAAMAFDERGKLIASSLKGCISDRLKGFDIPESGFFVSGGCVT